MASGKNNFRIRYVVHPDAPMRAPPARLLRGSRTARERCWIGTRAAKMIGQRLADLGNAWQLFDRFPAKVGRCGPESACNIAQALAQIGECWSGAPPSRTRAAPTSSALSAAVLRTSIPWHRRRCSTETLARTRRDALLGISCGGRLGEEAASFILTSLSLAKMDKILTKLKPVKTDKI